MFFRRPGTRPHEYRVKCNLSRARPFLFRPAFLFLLTRSPSEVCRILFRMLFRNTIQNFPHPTYPEICFSLIFLFFLRYLIISRYRLQISRYRVFAQLIQITELTEQILVKQQFFNTLQKYLSTYNIIYNKTQYLNINYKISKIYREIKLFSAERYNFRPYFTFIAKCVRDKTLTKNKELGTFSLLHLNLRHIHSGLECFKSRKAN